MLVPDTGGRLPAPVEVDKRYADDYAEACAILNRSPQSAAVLARRILQGLLVTQGKAPKGTLDKQIEHVTPSLRSDLAENLHHLRQLGNAGAHEWLDGTSEPVKPEVALVSFYLDVIVALFDHYYVGPAKARAARAGVDALLQQAGKQPVPPPKP